MRTSYGILTGLAIAVTLSGAVVAQDAPNLPTTRKQPGVAEETLGSQVRTAQVRQASVTVVDQTPQPGLSEVTKAVEDYFNDMSTYQANFVQTVTGEKTPSKGVFSLKRPGKFLWQYDTPVKQRIISTGSAVYYQDQERNQVTQLPVNAGVARLFNAKTLNMSQQGLRATRVQANSQLLVVEFAVEKKIKTGDNTGLTDLRLTFGKMPGGRLQLRVIDAVDTMNVTTRVEFGSVKENIELPNSMFNFTPGVYDSKN